MPTRFLHDCRRTAARNPPAPDVKRHATLPQSWMQRENWEFETHSQSESDSIGTRMKNPPSPWYSQKDGSALVPSRFQMIDRLSEICSSFWIASRSLGFSRSEESAKSGSPILDIPEQAKYAV